MRLYVTAKRKLIALLEEEKQAIINRAVTRSLDPNVRLKPTPRRPRSRYQGLRRRWSPLHERRQKVVQRVGADRQRSGPVEGNEKSEHIWTKRMRQAYRPEKQNVHGPRRGTTLLDTFRNNADRLLVQSPLALILRVGDAVRLSVRRIVWIGLMSMLAAAMVSACGGGSSPVPTDLPTTTPAPTNVPAQPTSDTTTAPSVPTVPAEPTATVLVLTPEPTPTQAPTATPTPEPSPVEIGTTVEAGGSSYTLNEIKDPAPAGVFGVDAGKRLVALDITQVGISDDGDPYNSLYFAVQDTDGYVHVPGFAEQADVGPSFGFGELAAGQIVRGWVVFELPESARLVSVLVEAEVFGAKITITDLAQDRDGDIVSHIPPPVPSPPSSPVEIRTTVEAGGSSYTLNEVKDPAPAGVFGVAADKRLVALDITQVGISDDGDPYNSLYFAVQDMDGYVHVPGFAEQADVGPAFGFGELAAGQIVRGWVVFELPESARLVSVLVEAEVFRCEDNHHRPSARPGR